MMLCLPAASLQDWATAEQASLHVQLGEAAGCTALLECVALLPLTEWTTYAILVLFLFFGMCCCSSVI